jgi:hypothetical protein
VYRCVVKGTHIFFSGSVDTYIFNKQCMATVPVALCLAAGVVGVAFIFSPYFDAAVAERCRSTDRERRRLFKARTAACYLAAVLLSASATHCMSAGGCRVFAYLQALAAALLMVGGVLMLPNLPGRMSA